MVLSSAPGRGVLQQPDSSRSQFKRVMILDCYVAMAKDWQQNYNSNEGGVLDPRVTDADVQQIGARQAAMKPGNLRAR